MEIGGRSLPPGETLGGRLAGLRRRRGLGRRVVAELAEISPTTLFAAEGDQGAHLATVARIGEALGAQLRLVPIGSPPQFWSTTAASSAHHGWTTPPDILEKLYRVIGGPFGLDPCSPARKGPRAPVRARLRYTAEDDGLSLHWTAQSVFMNPPYGRGLSAWVAKAHAETAAGRAGVVFGLVPARSDPGWWHDHIAGVADVWMLRGRLSFGDGTQAAPFPSAVVIWSATDEHRACMAREFPDAWHVPARAARPGAEATLAAD
jgi:hypothetical protein